MSGKLVIRSHRCALPDGRIEAASVVTEDGRIVAVLPYDDRTEDASATVVDAGRNAVLPGVVDSHVHINEPGRTEWEGFETATRAAAAGGITTVVDMPLNSIPPTTTVDNLKTKHNAAFGKCSVDVAFWGGVIPGNQEDLRPLLAAGVSGFKCFLLPSGVEEFPHVSEDDVRAALNQLKGTGGCLLFHAEVDCGVQTNTQHNENSQEFFTFLEQRPAVMEDEAIQLVIRLCEESQVPCHIVHLSSAGALPIIRDARSRGVPLTVETCHHYLYLTAEEVKTASPQYKCCPPIRKQQNQALLWEALKEGIIDMVVSDHSPSTPEMKNMDSGDFLQAWGGISSLQFGLSLLWTKASKRGYSLADICQWMCEQPAKLAGLDEQKGRIAVGMDADLVIFDPESTWEVTEDKILHRHKLTPYDRATLSGVVRKTFLRGELIYDEGSLIGEPQGKFLRANRL